MPSGGGQLWRSREARKMEGWKGLGRSWCASYGICYVLLEASKAYASCRRPSVQAYKAGEVVEQGQEWVSRHGGNDTQVGVREQWEKE